MDNETRAMFNTIIEEMGRMEDRINKRFDAVDNRFDKLESCLEIMQHNLHFLTPL